MIDFLHLPRATAAMALAGVLMATPAMAQTPDATIEFSGGSVAFIGKAQWGSGTLTFHGKRYPIRVGGLGIGSIGASHYSATGEVFNLKTVKDIEGVYGVASASATAGAGAGVLTMSNGAGVRIEARARSAGLQLTAAASGVNIQLK
jgi:hypothetical protein